MQEFGRTRVTRGFQYSGGQIKGTHQTYQSHIVVVNAKDNQIIKLLWVCVEV